MLARERLDELLLCRLSIKTKSPPPLADVSKTLFPFASLQLSASEWRGELNAALDRLRSAGDVAAHRLELTQAGRRRVCRVLGVEQLPKSRGWRDFRKRHLPRLIRGDHE